MNLSVVVLQAFRTNGWVNAWINYTDITKAVNYHLHGIGQDFKKASSVERRVRLLAQKGLLSSDRRGNFRLDRWKIHA